MDQNNLKCVVGQVASDQPAIIRFFDSVDSWSVDCFKDEFLWLQDYVKPSKIVVLINSDGGSVIQGMSVYSLISNCPIETECVIEGIAASMGSIIWAAGDKLFMHDYSILMIHNPWIGGKCDDPNSQAIIDAFKGQIRTIYSKRFNLSDDEVTAIMDGTDGVDGTYFTAKKAVERGIIPEGNIIETPSVTNAKLILEELETAVLAKNSVDLHAIAAKINDSLDPEGILKSLGGSIPSSPAVKDENKNSNILNNTQMNKEFQTVAALLGFKEAQAEQLDSVSAKITELMNAKAELEAVKSEREELNGKILAHEATISNLQSSLDAANATIASYKEAEAKQKTEAINAEIDEAIAAGKIKAETKESWQNFFAANEELARISLGNIPSASAGIKPISQQIADDEEAQKQAQAKQKALEDAQAAHEAKIKEVLGDETTFSTLG